MTLTAFLLVFLSVFLHAIWNFLSKKTNPSGAFYLLSSTTAALLWLGFFLSTELSFSSLPVRFWVLLACSIACEAVYCLGLAHAYRVADISLAYPLGRALPVLMIAAVALYPAFPREALPPRAQGQQPHSILYILKSSRSFTLDKSRKKNDLNSGISSPDDILNISYGSSRRRGYNPDPAGMLRNRPFIFVREHSHLFKFTFQSKEFFV